MIEQLETRYGTMFVPDTDNGQYWWLKTTGASPEDEMIEAVCAMLDERPRGIAIDCGANFGCWSLPLAKHSTAVIAFEPQRCVFRLLERTIRANPSLNIWAINRALGPDFGTIKVPDVDIDQTTNFGGVSLGIPHSEHPSAPMYDVAVSRMDGELAFYEGSEGSVSFIKVDCEGAELGIFQGARETILRWKPIIIAEADHPLTDTQALGAYIESLGYNVELFQDNNFIGMPL